MFIYLPQILISAVVTLCSSSPIPEPAPLYFAPEPYHLVEEWAVPRAPASAPRTIVVNLMLTITNVDQKTPVTISVGINKGTNNNSTTVVATGEEEPTKPGQSDSIIVEVCNPECNPVPRLPMPVGPPGFLNSKDSPYLTAILAGLPDAIVDILA